MGRNRLAVFPLMVMLSSHVVRRSMDFPYLFPVFTILSNTPYIFAVFAEHGIDSTWSVAFLWQFVALLLVLHLQDMNPSVDGNGFPSASVFAIRVATDKTSITAHFSTKLIVHSENTH